MKEITETITSTDVEKALDVVDSLPNESPTTGLAMIDIEPEEMPTTPTPTGGVTDEPEYLNRSGRRYLFSLLRKSKRGPNFTKPKKRR